MIPIIAFEHSHPVPTTTTHNPPHPASNLQLGNIVDYYPGSPSQPFYRFAISIGPAFGLNTTTTIVSIRPVSAPFLSVIQYLSVDLISFDAMAETQPNIIAISRRRELI